jgi:Tol biopolymer transport system component
MTSRKIRLAALVLLGLPAFLGLQALAAKGGKPPPEPADPAIAYVIGFAEIWVMDADGGNQTRIHEASAYLRELSWSPGGDQLAYCEGGDLWRMDVDVVDGVPRGSNATRLHESSGYMVTHPDWSPLGGEIVFGTRSTDGQNRTDIRMISASGGSAEIVYASPNGYEVSRPLWSPDGERLAFHEGTGGAGPSFRVLTLATGSVRTVLTGWQYGLDGLAHAHSKDVIAIQSGNNATGGKVFTLDLVSGDVTEHFGASGSVAWSSDDSMLVFHSLGRKYGLPDGLWTYEFATGEMVQLARKNAGRWPDWRR